MAKEIYFDSAKGGKLLQSAYPRKPSFKPSKSCDRGLHYSSDVKRKLKTYGGKHCEPNSLQKMSVWLNEGNKETRRTCDVKKKQREGTKESVSYKLIPSPEFKPGRVFLLPDISGHEYGGICGDKCALRLYTKQTNQLCGNNITRKAFCEVVGNDFCVDCNGLQLRQRFNMKINSLYPYLEYDKKERPYGYSPTSVRLTQPLPSTCTAQGSTEHVLNSGLAINQQSKLRILMSRVQGSRNYNGACVKPRPQTA